MGDVGPILDHCRFTTRGCLENLEKAPVSNRLEVRPGKHMASHIHLGGGSSLGDVASTWLPWGTGEA